MRIRLLSLLVAISRLHAWVLHSKSKTRIPVAESTTSLQSIFSQPKFSKPYPQPLPPPRRLQTTSSKSTTVIPPSPSPSTKDFFNADSRLAQAHLKRIRTAGRVGTKRFVDPCKVFIGNLPYNTTDVQLSQWISSKMGLPSPMLLHSCKVVVDWKTSQSKGYGFCVFTEPMYATVCIDKCQGQLLEGRKLTVSQGVKKEAIEVFVEKKPRRAIDPDELVIQEATAEVMDPEELELLKLLDPDLVDETPDNAENSETLDLQKNRAQRRQAARGKRRTKPQAKGFGT